MRYVVFGAGAVGGTIGGRLHAAGRDVVLIARGPHLAALQSGGLTLRSPDGDVRLQVPAVATPADAHIRSGDVTVLAMKSQDTAAALDALQGTAPQDVAVVCAQNGVENERMALRVFPDVYGMFVWMGVDHLTPGQVENFCSPTFGLLELGRYPRGVDAMSMQIASDLTAAGFVSRACDDIMRWKYAKLLANLNNAAEAISGTRAGARGLVERAHAEARDCFAAAGIGFASRDEIAERSRLVSPGRAIGDQRRAGSSSWQSLARQQGGIEADYLNGEVALLGRLTGVPTPVNAMLQQVANRLARERKLPGAVSIAELEASLASG